VPATLTDENGTYTLGGLPRGRYTVTAVKAGFVKETSSVEVSDAAAGNPYDFVLSKAAVISGTVIDESGEPVVAARVNVVRLTSSGAGGRMSTVASAETDDLGVYRISGLPAGTSYLVETSAGLTRGMFEVDARSPMNARSNPRFYYPGVTDVGAAGRMAVEAGEERAGIVFTVPVQQAPGPQMPGPAGRADVGVVAPVIDLDPRTTAVIKGRIMNSNGTALQGARITAVDAYGAAGSGGGPYGTPVSGGALAFSGALGASSQPLGFAGPSGRETVVAPGALARATSSGADGSYELILTNVTASAWFRVAVTRAGYQGAEYGQRNPLTRGEPLLVNPAGVTDHVDVALQRPAVIAGRIVDDLGEPVEGAAVRTAQLRYVNGRRQLVDVGAVRRTDDLGRYRLFGLRPGQYAVIAAVGQIVAAQPSADLPGYGTTYFPGVADPQGAQFVQVAAAQEVEGVDFSLSRMKSARVTGTAVDETGEPVTGGIALMPSARSGGNTEIQMGARIDRLGAFEFSNVPPGDYVLQVVHGRSNPWNEGEFAYRFVTVTDSDVTGLEMQTSTGSTLAGRIVADGGEIAKVDSVQVTAVPVDIDRSPRLGGPPGRARVEPDGGFELVGINGPRRIEVTRAPAGWTEKAILVAGVDVTDQVLPFGRDDQSLEDIEVVLTSRSTQIAGSLGDLRGVAAADYAVLAFAVDENQWYQGTRFRKRATPAGDGTFSIEGLPSGDYFVVAAEAPRDPGEWLDPEVLAKLSTRATRIRLADGQHVSLALRPLAP
jgi:protocatechuate 3,4-dioxygenase beta subunit